MKRLLLLLPLLVFSNVYAHLTPDTQSTSSSYHDTYINNFKTQMRDVWEEDYETTYEDDQQTGKFTVHYVYTDDDGTEKTDSIEFGTTGDVITYEAQNNSGSVLNYARSLIVYNSIIAAGVTKGYTMEQAEGLASHVEKGVDSYSKYGYDIEIDEPDNLESMFDHEWFPNVRMDLNNLTIDYNNMVKEFSMENEQDSGGDVTITLSALGFDTTKTCEIYTIENGIKTLVGEVVCDGEEELLSTVPRISTTTYAVKVKGSDFYRTASYSVDYGEGFDFDDEDFNFPSSSDQTSNQSRGTTQTNGIENPQTGLKSSVYMFILIAISIITLLFVNKNKIFKKL